MLNDFPINRPRRDILVELRDQGRFCDFMLVAWGIVEQGAIDNILRAHKMSTTDPESARFTRENWSVGSKLKHLKELGLLSEEEYNIVFKFKEKRNSLFHKGALFTLNLSQSEKDDIMILGMQAADIVHDLRLKGI